LMSTGFGFLWFNGLGYQLCAAARYRKTTSEPKRKW